MSRPPTATTPRRPEERRLEVERAGLRRRGGLVLRGFAALPIAG